MGVHSVWGELPLYLKMKKTALVLTMLLALAVALTAVSVITVPNPQVVPGPQAFQVQVHLNSVTQIRGYTIYMGYDPAIIDFTSATRGSLFNGLPVNWFQVSEPSPGVLGVECLIFGPGLHVTGPGNILNLNFTALVNGYSDLDFIFVELYEPTVGAIIPGVESTMGAVIIGISPAYFTAKCYLQGPYASGVMSTGINPLIPLTSPYAADPVTVTEIPEDVVDWMLVELRQTQNGPAFRSQSVFLHSNGMLTSPGKPFVLFMNTPAGSYYVVLRHRNHLSAISSFVVSLAGSGSPAFYNFTLPGGMYGGNGSVALETGIYGMAAGDADQNAVIDNNDRVLHWRLNAGKQGYLAADFDFDGNVFPSDLNEFWRPNLGKSSDVPQP